MLVSHIWNKHLILNMLKAIVNISSNCILIYCNKYMEQVLSLIIGDVTISIYSNVALKRLLLYVRMV